jgi:hypothetical protein
MSSFAAGMRGESGSGAEVESRLRKAASFDYAAEDVS